MSKVKWILLLVVMTGCCIEGFAEPQFNHDFLSEIAAQEMIDANLPIFFVALVVCPILAAIIPSFFLILCMNRSVEVRFLMLLYCFGMCARGLGMIVCLCVASAGEMAYWPFALGWLMHGVVAIVAIRKSPAYAVFGLGGGEGSSSVEDE
jgi:uncharacterized membrane protein